MWQLWIAAQRSDRETMRSTRQFGVTTNLAVPHRALAVGAHPDDIEFGCGATLAKWAAQGCEVHLLVLTDGAKGTWDTDADIAALIQRRQSEQRAAADILGATGVHLLDNVDGELQVTITERARVCEVIRRTRPEVVLGHDPWQRYRLHPDHHAAGQLTIDGIVAARDPHFFREQQLERHRPHTLLLFEAEVRDHVEIVTDFVDLKVEALLAHTSQYESTHGIATDPQSQTTEFRNGIVDDAHAAQREFDSSSDLLAEAFKRLNDL